MLSLISRTKSQTSVVVTLSVVVLAILAGLVSSTGNYLFNVLFLGIILSGFFLFKPIILFWFLLLLTLVVNGLATYYLHFHQIQWVMSIVGFVLIINSFIYKRRSLSAISPILWLLVFFFLLQVVGLILNGASIAQFLSGIRTYVPYWGVFLMLVCYVKDDNIYRNALYVFMLVAALQWVFGLQQRLFVVPDRINSNIPGSPWDSVVGTFGGDMYGGGESGALAIFIVVVITFLYSLKKDNQIKKKIYWLLIAFSFLMLILMEVKVVFILVPLVYFLVNKEKILKRPLQFVVGISLIAVLMSLVLLFYSKFHWQEENFDLSERLLERFSYSFDPDFMVESGKPGRIGSIVNWYKNSDFVESPIQLLFGYGLSAVNESSAVIQNTNMADRFGYGLESIGITKLLWEVGILGVSIFFAIIGYSYLLAIRLIKSGCLKAQDKSLVNASRISLIVMVISLFYERTIVSSPSSQLILMLVLAYISSQYINMSEKRESK